MHDDALREKLFILLHFVFPEQDLEMVREGHAQTAAHDHLHREIMDNDERKQWKE